MKSEFLHLDDQLELYSTWIFQIMSDVYKKHTWKRKIYKNGYIYKVPLFYTSGEIDYAGHIYRDFWHKYALLIQAWVFFVGVIVATHISSLSALIESDLKKSS